MGFEAKNRKVRPKTEKSVCFCVLEAFGTRKWTRICANGLESRVNEPGAADAADGGCHPERVEGSRPGGGRGLARGPRCLDPPSRKATARQAALDMTEIGEKWGAEGCWGRFGPQIHANGREWGLRRE